MTENAAITRMRYRIDTATDIAGRGSDGKAYEDMEMAINALEEIQQYRAIGTVEECWEAREKQWVKDIIHNPDGGVDKDWLCPTCGKFCSPYSKHCQNCGQAVKEQTKDIHSWDLTIKSVKILLIGVDCIKYVCQMMM